MVKAHHLNVEDYLTFLLKARPYKEPDEEMERTDALEQKHSHQLRSGAYILKCLLHRRSKHFALLLSMV
jgi:hypothetical protein